VYAFVWDLTQYAFHRLQHATPALWATHRFHHDETALSAVAQARHHPTSTVLAALFHLPVLILLGAQVPHLVAAFLMFTLWGFVNHANLRIGFGPMTPVIAGPQWHRIHHSIRDEHRDRNFAALFPVIDVMFGTYWHPRHGEYPPTGVREPHVPSLRAATVDPFVAWYRMVYRRPARI
jgi:sterol desaturase/sphingolipid hydroxylase (fatty acid hydroxylase superfamily)